MPEVRGLENAPMFESEPSREAARLESCGLLDFSTLKRQMILAENHYCDILIYNSNK